ncbi:uncharacterized protein JCM6883_003232 [Sporobolomyces salmoneus]|uniref:uncharacterized protein n=1 Tax=Sporobolomyces salmoneus TaxID=183962 RepID=UPI00316B8E0D
MRTYSVVLSLLVTFALSVLYAEPVLARTNRERSGAGGVERVGVPFGRPPNGDLYKDVNRRGNVAAAVGGGGSGGTGMMRARDSGKESAADGAANYLITLERSVTNDVKDKILDILLRSGAVVKQTYDYRVFKGILFTVPQNDDKGLTSWQTSLGKQEGVKYVEEDSVVKIQ